MPILDPGRRRPEADPAVDLDLSQERPTVDQVKLDVQTPVIGVKAFFANGSLVVPAFTFMIVGGVAVGVAYMTMRISTGVAALVSMVVVFVSGLAFVDRWRGK
jgi:hypothetical protein